LIVDTVTEQEFLQRFLFAAGEYEVVAVSRSDANERRTLLVLRFPRDDYDDARHVPQADLSMLTDDSTDRRRVMKALVRAGIRHPGLADCDLRDLHRVARREGHVELFADLNALSTGLVRQLVDSLGRRCCRVVISSSSIDILHEYQGGQKKKDQATFLRRAEMARCLATLEELRREVAVHVHPLPPGATSYMRRAGAERPDSEDSGVTYISEDRQMVSAFWHYLSTTSPRVPVRLVTSDFSLARVCAAERVPFLFAKTPYEVWGREQLDQGQPAAPESLWFDPFALGLCSSSMHRILLELAYVYQLLHIVARPKSTIHNTPNEGGQFLSADFGLSFDGRTHLPGHAPTITIGDPGQMSVSPKRSAKKASEVTAPIRRKLKLSLTTLLNVLPTRAGQSVPLSNFEAKDEDAYRQLVQIGQATDLYAVIDDKIVGQSALDSFLGALHRRDYMAVNAVFRKIATYDEVLLEAASGKPFPSSTAAGAVTGWAVVLGAAYKTTANGTLYGLADLPEDRFEQAVLHAHTELGKGQRSVQLPPIMDRVCRSILLSPIRFEALLDATIGKRGLSDFEAQRARADFPIPKHPVIVAPTTASSSTYLRVFDPGRGLIIGNKLVGALVKRGSQT
jgi:hypothetical protein